MITQTVNGLERIVVFKPGWHKIHEEPSKNFGVHGMEIHMIIKGPLGAVHFIYSTGMMLRQTYDWWEETNKGTLPHRLMSMGIDVGYHSPKPLYKEQKVRWPTKMKRKNPKMDTLDKDATQEERIAYFDNIEWETIGDKPPVCEHIGVPCYYDGSALRAEEWFDFFKEKGDETIWEMLEEEYNIVFTDTIAI